MNWLKKRLAWARFKNRMAETKPVASPPPEWFVELYDNYLKSEEGQRLYGRKDDK